MSFSLFLIAIQSTYNAIEFSFLDTTIRKQRFKIGIFLSLDELNIDFYKSLRLFSFYWELVEDPQGPAWFITVINGEKQFVDFFHHKRSNNKLCHFEFLGVSRTDKKIIVRILKFHRITQFIECILLTMSNPKFMASGNTYRNTFTIIGKHNATIVNRT